MRTITRYFDSECVLSILLLFCYHIEKMHAVCLHFPLKGLAMSLILAIVMSGANWQLASCKKFRIWKSPIWVWRNSDSEGKQADRQTNVHSNVVSVRLFLQKLRFDVHWFACLLVCLLNGNSAKLYSLWLFYIERNLINNKSWWPNLVLYF